MIPKVLHQVWLGPKQPPTAAMATWQEQHPDWQYILWTEANLPQMRHRDLFDAFTGVYHGQADVLRYEILWQQGGIALDADSMCVQPLDKRFLERVWAVYENERARPGLIANGFMGAPPEDPFIGAVLDELGKLFVDVIADEDRAELHRLACGLTGPYCVTEVAKATGLPIQVFPSFYFLPEHYSGARYDGEGPVYAHHWWGATKGTYE